MAHKYDHDIFISHASEDKDDFVRPLAQKLKEKGYRVWYDEFSLTLGDSLSSSIDKGILESRFGIIVLSPNFFQKQWTQRELEGLVQKEISYGKVILPIWHHVSYEQVLYFSPPLANKLASCTSQGLDKVVNDIVAALTKADDVNKKKPNTKKPNKRIIFKHRGASDSLKKSKHKTKTVNLTLEGISQLFNDKPIVYKILTKGGKNNYTGVAKKGKVRATIQEHLQSGKNYVPGFKVCIEQMNSIQEAQQKADRIIRRSTPKYNKSVK